MTLKSEELLYHDKWILAYCHEGQSHDWEYVGEYAESRLIATCLRCGGITPNTTHPGGWAELIRLRAAWER